jgi:nucleoid-associated protein YgaU
VALLVVACFVIWRVFYATTPLPEEGGLALALPSTLDPPLTGDSRRSPSAADDDLDNGESVASGSGAALRDGARAGDDRPGSDEQEDSGATRDASQPDAATGVLGHDGGAGPALGTRGQQPAAQDRSAGLGPQRSARREGAGRTAELLTPMPGRDSVRIERGQDLLAQNRPIEARQMLTTALVSGEIGRTEAAAVRGALGEINQALVFGPHRIPGDPYALSYVVRSSDTLEKITRRHALQVDWRFIQRINNIRQAHLIREGQELKLITGPFHAVVHRDAFRMDVYLGDDLQQVYVCSFPVGLGSHGSTPLGLFRVRKDSKLINPEWINPRTRQRFSRDDPKNPIGEYWVGLDGIGESTRTMIGYGVHGTIEPDSIGRQASMGCIRLLPNDIRLVWEMLAEGVSTVEIVD